MAVARSPPSAVPSGWLRTSARSCSVSCRGLIRISPRQETEQLLALVRSQPEGTALGGLLATAMQGDAADKNWLQRALVPLLPEVTSPVRAQILTALARLLVDPATLAAYLE